jgi:hypothetical protein
MAPTTDKDQPLLINDLYHPNKDNITMTTRLLIEANIVEQLQTHIMTTTESSLNNDEVMYWNISPTIHDRCYEAHNIRNIPRPQGNDDQELTGDCHHWEEYS